MSSNSPQRKPVMGDPLDLLSQGLRDVIEHETDPEIGPVGFGSMQDLNQ
jgi:hypothetical protein